MIKKTFAGLAVLFSAALILSGCGAAKEQGSGSSKDNTIRVGYGTGLCHAPLHVAIEKGYFADEGLKVEPIKVETAVISEAISADQVDASFGLVGKFAQPLENGLPIKMTAGIHTGCLKILVAGDSSINSIADLKGKKIGVAGLADSPAFITKRALAAAGVGVTADNLEVEFIVYSNSDLPIALKNGAIDAFAAGDPVASRAETEYGLKTILDSAKDPLYKDEYCCVSFVSTKFFQQHKDLAEKYTRAVMKASAWIEENPEETAQLQVDKDYVAGDPKFNAELLSGYHFMPSVNGGYEALKVTMKELQQIGILNSGTDVTALIENSFGHIEGLEDSVAKGE